MSVVESASRRKGSKLVVLWSYCNILDAKNLDTARCSGAYIAVTTLAYRDWSDSEQSEVPTDLVEQLTVCGRSIGLRLGFGQRHAAVVGWDPPNRLGLGWRLPREVELLHGTLSG